MNVQIVIGTYPPDHSGGGLRIQKTYMMLSDLYDVDYRVLAEPIRPPCNEADYPNVRRLSSKSWTPFLLLQVFWHIFSGRKNTDLIHCVGPTKLTVLAAVISKLLKIPLVTELSIEYNAAHRQNNFFSAFFLKQYFTPSYAIALSPRIAEQYKDYGMPVGKVFLRPNPVMLHTDEGVITDSDIRLLEQIKQAPFKYKHLILGRICPRKNQISGLNILDKLTDDHGLIIAGPVIGEEDYAAQLHDAIKSRNLECRVIYWPHRVDNPGPLYKAISLLWCPSHLEGLPNVVLEALFSGRPCVVNKELGLGDWVVHDGRNGLEFSLEDTEKTAADIQRFISDGIDTAHIMRCAKEEFDASKLNERTFEVLQLAMNEGKDANS